MTGAGKTEVVSQRVASLLAEGVAPESIVAFTFTERAATELKNRIAARVEQRLGGGTLDRMGRLFVGTIHSYCFRLLQVHAPRYETFDVMDDNQLMALLARESNRLQIKSLAKGLGPVEMPKPEPEPEPEPAPEGEPAADEAAPAPAAAKAPAAPAKAPAAATAPGAKAPVVPVAPAKAAAKPAEQVPEKAPPPKAKIPTVDDVFSDLADEDKP